MNTEEFINELVENGLDNNTIINHVRELQEDNNACAVEIAVLEDLIRETTKENELLIKQKERATSLEFYWRSSVEQHSDKYNKMGRTLDKIDKLVRRGFVNLGDDLNNEVFSLMRESAE